MAESAVIKDNTVRKPPREKIARLFTVSLMSNSKWRKMISMLGPLNANVKLEQVIVKFIDDEAEHRIGFPGTTALRTPWAYIDLAPTGPVALSAIEWMEFPTYAVYERSWPNDRGRIRETRVAQDIDKAEAVIAKLGKYPLERTTRGLRITGHIRRQRSN